MSGESNGFKLLLSYEIRPDAGQSYYRFMLGRYVPLLAELGLEMTDAWHTAFGEYPSRLVGFVSRDEETLRGVMEAEIWADLNQELLRYVTDFEYKVIPYRLGFQA